MMQYLTSILNMVSQFSLHLTYIEPTYIWIHCNMIIITLYVSFLNTCKRCRLFKKKAVLYETPKYLHIFTIYTFKKPHLTATSLF